MSELKIGTSGWSYPTDPGSWNGVFYPTRVSGRAKKLDELRYYAERFNTVEVNSTFYRTPAESVARSWVRRTPADFEFSIKLFQKFTHPGMYKRATGEEAQIASADVEAFRRGIDPIADAGKLGAVLAQFPASFKAAEETREYLAALLETFSQYPMAVELRHRTWSDDMRATMSLLNEHDAAWVQIDEPKFRFSIRQNFMPNVSGFYYMRLHGRNADKWWRHETSADRYNYLYSAEELAPVAEVARAARKQVKKLYAYLNNHFESKAVANAAMLKHQLGIPNAGEYTAEFIARFPELRGIVSAPEAGDPQATLPSLSHTSS